MKTPVKLASLLIIIFSFSSGITTAQDFDFEGGINYKLPGKYLNYGFGINLSAELRFMEHYAGRISAAYLLSAFHNNQYFGGDQYAQGSYVGEFLYYFSNGTPQLYTGLGIGYYISNISPESMHPHIIYPSNGTTWVTRNVVDNDVGYNILAGIKFTPDKPFSFGFEVKYVFLNPSWTTFIVYKVTEDYSTVDRINLNTFITKLTFNFRLG